MEYKALALNNLTLRIIFLNIPKSKISNFVKNNTYIF